MRSRLAKAGRIQFRVPIPGSNRSAINQAGIKLRRKVCFGVEPPLSVARTGRSGIGASRALRVRAWNGSLCPFADLAGGMGHRPSWVWTPPPHGRSLIGADLSNL
jgi:hypothetical protein